VSYLSKKIDFEGNLARLIGIVSKLLQVIGFIIIVAGFAGT